MSKHVAESVKRLIDKERESKVVPLANDTVYRQVHEYLVDWEHPVSIDAITSLDYIRTHNARHLVANLTEMELLRLVWQRINHPVNQAHQDDLKEALAFQLADCQQHGSVVCTTGRTTRLLPDPKNVSMQSKWWDFKPMWAISRVGDYCGRYSDKLLERAPANFQAAYNALNRTPAQQQLVDQFTECLKSNLERKFKLMYLDTQLLTPEQLHELTKTYYEHLVSD